MGLPIERALGCLAGPQGLKVQEGVSDAPLLAPPPPRTSCEAKSKSSCILVCWQGGDGAVAALGHKRETNRSYSNVNYYLIPFIPGESLYMSHHHISHLTRHLTSYV